MKPLSSQLLKFIRYYLPFIIVLGGFQAQAGIFKPNVASPSWATSSNWTLVSGSDIGTAGPAGDDVMIDNTLIAGAPATVSTSGTLTIASLTVVPAITLNLNTSSLTVTGSTTINGSLSDGSNTGSNTFAGAFTNNGIVTVTNSSAWNFSSAFSNPGTFNVTGGSGIFTFNGAFSNTGTFNVTGGSGAYNFNNTVTNNTITAAGLTLGGSGNKNFSGNIIPTAGLFTIGSSGNLVFASSLTIQNGAPITSTTSGNNTVNANVTVTNLNASVTFTTMLSGPNATAVWNNSTNSKVTFLSGATAVDAASFTFQASATGNTVEFARVGGTQNIPGLTYYNLITSGSGARNGNGLIVVGNDLTVGAGITLDAGSNNFTVSGNTIVNGTLIDANSAGANLFSGTFTNNGTVTVTTNSAWTFSSAFLNTSAFNANNGSAAITYNGTFSNTGTYTVLGAMTGNYVFANTVTNNTAASLGIAGTGSKTFNGDIIPTAGTFTLSAGSVIFGNTLSIQSGTAVNFSTSGSATVGAGFTVTNLNASVTFGGTLTGTNATAGWINAANSKIIVKAAGTALDVANLTVTASAAGNTVEYAGIAQNIPALASGYFNLVTSGTLIKTSLGNISVANNLTIGAGTSVDVSNFDFTVLGASTINGTFTDRAAITIFTGDVTINGTYIDNTAFGATSFNGNLVLNAGSFFNINQSGLNVTLAQDLQINTTASVITHILSSITMSGSSKQIYGTASTAKNLGNLIITGSVTNNLSGSGSLTIGGTNGISGSGSFTQGAGSILNISSATTSDVITVSVFDANSNLNTVNYSAANNQTVHTTMYRNFGVNGGAFVKSITADITINDLLTFTSGQLGTGNFTLFMGASSSTALASAASNVLVTGTGKMARYFSANGSFTFPVANNTPNTAYSPTTLTLTSATYGGAAYAAVAPVGTAGPNLVNSNYALQRYWNVTSSGISAATGNLTSTYVTNDVAGTESGYVSAYYNDTTWTIGTSSDINTSANTTRTLFTDVPKIDGKYSAGENFSIIASTFYSRNTTGSWSDPTAWSFVPAPGVQTSAGAIPAIGSRVIIENGDNMNLDVSTAVISNITIEAGGVLTYTSNNAMLSVTGSLKNDGTVIGNSTNNSIRFSANATPCKLDGSGDFNMSATCGFDMYNNVNIQSTAQFSMTNAAFIYKADNITVNNSGDITIIAGNANVISANGQANATWNNATGSSVVFNTTNTTIVNGSLVFNTSAVNNTVGYQSTISQNLIVPSDGSYYDLVIGGSNNKSLTSTLNVLGDLSISSTFISNNNPINLSGNWTNEGTFTPGSTVVTLLGTSDQTISNSLVESFYRLDVTKPSGSVLLGNDVIVSNTLTMNQGNILTHGHKITVGTGTLNLGTVTRTGGNVVGQIEKWFNGASSFIFPVGTASFYRPVAVNFNTSVAGTVAGEFVPAVPGNVGLPIEDGADTVYNTFSEGYWAMTAGNSLVSTDYNVSVTATDFVSFPIIPTTRLMTRSSQYYEWFPLGTHVSATGTVVSRNNDNLISAQYALGDIVNCSLPVAPIVTGAQDVCAGTSNVYAVGNYDPSQTYTWTTGAGSVVGYPAPNHATVVFSNTAGADSVVVSAVNSCGVTGTQTVLKVSTHTVPTSEISGSAAVSALQQGTVYSVEATSGYTYTWSTTDPGATITNQGQNSIIIDWGSVIGNYIVSVVASSSAVTAGCSNAAQVDLNVTVGPVFTTQASGAWTTDATWIGNVVPPAGANVIIKHAVTLNTSKTVTNFEIDFPGSVVSASNVVLTVKGNYVNNGSHTAVANSSRTIVLDLRGNGTDISGIGTINIASGRMRFAIGNKNILSGTVLTITTTALVIQNRKIVTNNGSITVIGTITSSVNNSNAKWINGNGSFLGLNGGGTPLSTVLLYTANTVNEVAYGSASNQSITTPADGKYYNLTITGSSNKSLKNNVVVANDFFINNGIYVPGTYTTTIGGNWKNIAGIFTSGTSTVNFNGTADQTITTSGTNEIFYNLTVNKAGGTLHLNNDVVVANTLNFMTGNINAGTYKLTLGTSSTVLGTLTRTSGNFIGNFERWIKSATLSSYVFPVGTATRYNPLTISNFSSDVTGSLLVTLNTVSGSNTAGLPFYDNDFVANGLDTVRTASKDSYWALTTDNGFTLGGATFSLNLDASGFIGKAVNTSSRLITRTSSGANWAPIGTHITASGNIVKRNVVGVIGEYTVGDTLICPPSLTPLAFTSSPASVCTIQHGVPYSVSANVGSTYTWILTGGAKASGGKTNSITVNWANVGTTGKVRVIENTGCGTSGAIEVDVSINPILTSPITGPNYVTTNLTGTIYSVIASPGYSYAWSVVNGGAGTTISAGQGTNVVTIDWGTSVGNGVVKCVGIPPAGYGGATCENAAPVTLTVTRVLEFPTHANLGSVAYNNVNTWECACVPPANSSIRVRTGTTLSLVASTIVNNVTTESAGNIDNGTNNVLTVNGNYSLGSGAVHTGTSPSATPMIVLQGSGTKLLDGSGSVVLSGSASMLVKNALRNTQTTTNLTFTTAAGGNFTIASSAANIGNFGTLVFNTNVVGSVTSASIIQKTNSILKASGALLTTGILNASATPNTVEYTGAAAQVVKLPTPANYSYLTVSGSGSKSLGSALSINNDITLASGSVFAPGKNLTLKGNWINNGATFTPSTFTVLLTGTNQTISKTGGETFSNLTLSGAGTKTINNPLTISGLLTLTNGILKSNALSDTIKISSTTAISGGSSSSYINGILSQRISAAGSKVYPVGDGTNYLPVTLNYPTVTTAGVVAVKVTNGDHPNIASSACINASQSVNKYWTINKVGSGVKPAPQSFSAIFGYPALPNAGIADAGASSGFSTYLYNGAAWSTLTTTSSTNTATTINPVVLYGNYQLAIGATGSGWSGGAGTTDWFTAGNWGCGGVPTSTIDATIPTGVSVYPEINATANVKSLTITSGGIVTVLGSNTLNVYGNWANSGAFVPTISTVVFTGATSTAISGTSTTNFRVLKVDKTSPATLTVSAPVVLHDKLTFGTAAVNTLAVNNAGGGSFTFRSDASSTAHIDVLSTVTKPIFSGNFTCQKYLPGQAGRYNFMLGVPVTNAFVSTFQPTTFDMSGRPTNGFPVTGPFTGTSTGSGLVTFANSSFAYNPATGLYTAYPVAGGNIATSGLAIGRAYRFSIRDNASLATTVAKTLTVTGTLVPAGSFTFTGLVNGSGTKPFNGSSAILPAGGLGGWNLVSNPYMSDISINMSNTANWTKSNVSNATYIYNADTRGFLTCASGVGTCIIPAFQGFWVKANGTPSLTINETAKISTTNNAEMQRVAQNSVLNYLGITLSTSSAIPDKTYIRYTTGAEFGNDGFDGYELGATQRTALSEVSVYTKAIDNAFYDVNAKPYNFASDTTKLLVKLPAGPAKLDFSDIGNLEFGYQIALFDKFTNTLTDVIANPVYNFVASDDSNSTGPRFEVIFNNRTTAAEEVELNGELVTVFPNPSAYNHIKLMFGNYSGKVDVKVYDLVGNLVYTADANIDSKSILPLTIAHVAPGMYTVKVSGDHLSATRKLIIK